MEYLHPANITIKLQDFHKLHIVNGIIFARMWQQDGTMQEMRFPDTLMNRLVVSWIKKYDRYSPQGVTHSANKEDIVVKRW